MEDNTLELNWPQTQVQLCLVHLMRNSLKDVPWKQQREVAADLKSIYPAATVEQAEAALTSFAQKCLCHFYPCLRVRQGEG